MPKPTIKAVPKLLGLAPFGDPDRFRAAAFAGTAAQADQWLGNPPGTTVYDPGPAIAICGALVGPDAPTVAAAQGALQALAGAGPGRAILPTGLGWQGWDVWESCSFGPTDLVFDPAGVGLIGSWGLCQLAYRLLLRRGRPWD